MTQSGEAKGIGQTQAVGTRVPTLLSPSQAASQAPAVPLQLPAPLCGRTQRPCRARHQALNLPRVPHG